jgi:putative flippase GtrA
VIKHFLTKQFFLFLIVGGVAALLHWLARILFSLWWPFPLAVAMAYVIGMSVAFLLNSFLVFKKSVRAGHKQARDFIVTNLAFFPIVWFSSLKIREILRDLGVVFYPDAIAHAMAICLPVIGTFLIYKFFAFKEVANE